MISIRLPKFAASYCFIYWWCFELYRYLIYSCWSLSSSHLFLERWLVPSIFSTTFDTSRHCCLNSTLFRIKRFLLIILHPRFIKKFIDFVIPSLSSSSFRILPENHVTVAESVQVLLFYSKDFGTVTRGTYHLTVVKLWATCRPMKRHYHKCLSFRRYKATLIKNAIKTKKKSLICQ